MMAAAYPILVADIGGTNARFGLVHAAGAMPSDIRKLPGENYSSLSDALKDYLRSVGGERPRRGCIAVAGPVEEGHFILTNRPSWSTPLEPLAREYRLDRLEVINDFQALAAALPLIEPGEIRPIGEPMRGEEAAPRAVVGPGTGLGVGAVFRTPVGWQALPGEGGHVELASADPRGRAAIAAAAAAHGRASAERLLSGPGLELLHVVLGQVDGRARNRLDASQIHERATLGDREASDTVATFFLLLAGFAGDVALMFGARGGVFLAGGVAARLYPLLDHDAFRAAFMNKGRLKPYLAAIPASLIAADTLALRGCAAHMDSAGGARTGSDV
jgi:glucokinase